MTSLQTGDIAFCETHIYILYVDIDTDIVIFHIYHISYIKHHVFYLKICADNSKTIMSISRH
jgi:hypothetical protein